MQETGFATPQDAEAAFYDAFERRDLDAMMAVWATEAHIECIHPMGDRLRGTAAIRDSWQQLFAHGPALRFTIVDANRSQDALLAIHVVYENITTDSQDSPAPLIATNIYQCTRGGWHMILHHASPSPSTVAQADDLVH